MAITLGHNQYGKDEIRVVRLLRATEPHQILDYNVNVSLVGDFDAAHLEGDNRNVVPTDTSKNTTFAYAKHDDVVAQPESYGLALARHFVDDVEAVSRARISLEMYPWTRLTHDGAPHPYSFVRTGSHVRTACVTYDGTGTWVVSGVKDMTVLKTTDSEFVDFYTDQYTTLQAATDRILATTIRAQWWHTDTDRDWGQSFDTVHGAMLDAFAGHYSKALQQSAYLMGEAALTADPGVAEIRFTCPNSHHFAYDLEKMGIDNNNEVFHADDRPYGQIEATIRRDDAGDPGPAFDPGQGW
ncbi:urate oxidase [soil metagenome]